ncbi:ABC transporter permease [Microbulbifer thermotolerans]|uniref:Peptide ABC transporter permease n=1 Tax=Microbulbifer thermotolerans TaxID=252514 RepID=A0A143HI54_MICTH|nr:ABC transporter permease [Microbulbifer thermotolerans]AMX01187.1 peptide ABC transporter permease [Microbulbifer thermotolerans]MCX2830824.1 ABC transporter permease [Microbulbifer thermotolerans]
MGSLFSQIVTVTAMNIRSLPRRLWMSLAMVLASAVVVAVLMAFLAMAKGFEATMEGAGSDRVAILMREGAAAELNSVLTREQVNLVAESAGIARDAQGPLISPELYVIVDGIKKASGTEANIPLRGLNAKGMAMRENMHLLEGRMFTPGTNEMIVGAGVLREFDGFEIGKEVRFGKNVWTVVGIFSTGGNVFESELWADAAMVQAHYNRGSSYQTIRVQLQTPGDLAPLRETIEREPRLNLDIQTERDYFANQGEQLRYMAIFGRVISFVMALGALAGALNTMYTSVADRAKEIATLRALGFGNFSAFCGTVAEALVLAAAGGLLGSLAAFLFFDGLSTSTLGGSFTQVVFSFEVSPDLFMQGAALALFIGFVSGFFPAWRAARVPVVVAFRNGA